MKLYYRNYRPLINSILFGFLFIWAGIAMDNDFYSEVTISLLVIFLPAIYTLTTNTFKDKKILHSIFFILVSYAIYYLAVALFLYNDHTYHSIFYGAFFSSLFYQLLSKYFFERQTPLILILIIATLSSLSFLTFQFEWCKTYLGLGIFLWMTFNSVITLINFNQKSGIFEN